MEVMMMKISKYLMYITFLIFASTSLSARSDSASEIELLNSTMAKSFGKGDIAQMVDLYTRDAVMLPPSSEILSNQEDIKRYWDGLRKIGVYDYSIYAVNHDIEGNVAYATALWEARRKTANGNVITMDGNISNVYEKQDDGSWKIRLQSWN